MSGTFHFLVWTVVCLICLSSTVYATCGCVCDEENKANSYIVELSGEARECDLPVAPPASNCYKIDCAKCGQILECYVDTGDSSIDQQVCDVVNEDQFCSVQSGKDKFKTLCGQQCSGSEGRICYPSESWGECPAVISSNVTTCKAGANGGPAQLSNFASYKICIGGGGSSCKAAGVCSTDAIGGSSYSCMVSEGCTSSDPITCLSMKCDSDTDISMTCPCAINL